MLIQAIFVSLLTTQVLSYGSDNRIVYSFTASANQFPHQVSLARSNIWGVPDQLEQRSYCGGSIINNSWILTAAYCVYGIPTTSASRIIILAGKHNLTDTFEPHQQSRLASRIHIHPSYPGQNAQHDIALIKLSEPLVFDAYVKPVVLPNLNANHSGEGYISGWGSTSKTEIEIMPNILHYDHVPLVAYDVCRNTMKQMGIHLEIFSTQLCTGPRGGIISTCIGDSGGPLVTNYLTNGKYEQIGIVSWGLYPCGISEISSVYTRVSYYVSWINQIMSTY
ncbi:trypsin-like [Aphidius gifuensis]|uniref:trypsin-like n=1 Tax=Aphidius gifuensis TaxID=684658 RepID=UPI001CDC69E4|nr:trypsin-like [Aphidius gifuensis]